MSVKAVLESLEGLAEELKALYVEKDGKFFLDVEPVGGVSLENVANLKSALSKERENVRTLKDKMQTFEGLDADAARDALQKLEEMGSWDSKTKSEELRKSIQKQFGDKHEKEMKDRDEKIGMLTRQVEDLLVVGTATKAIAEKKGSVDLLLPHVRSRVKMRQGDNGQYLVEIVDEKGSPRISQKSGSMDPMSIDELVDEMSKSTVFAPAFDGAGSVGSGSPSDRTTARRGGAHRLSWQEAHDPKTYQAAKEAATKAGVELQIDSFTTE